MNVEQRFAGFDRGRGEMTAYGHYQDGKLVGLGLPAAPGKGSPLTSWTISREAVDRWLASAKVDDRLIYAHGSLTDQSLGAYVRSLMDAGELALRQERSVTDRAIDYVAIRCAPPAKAPALEPEPDLYLVALLGRLERAARRGLKCPTDQQLADELGLKRSQVKDRMRRLVIAGKIATRLEPHAGPSPWRVVTILATAKETARPPK